MNLTMLPTAPTGYARRGNAEHRASTIRHARVIAVDGSYWVAGPTSDADGKRDQTLYGPDTIAVRASELAAALRAAGRTHAAEIVDESRSRMTPREIQAEEDIYYEQRRLEEEAEQDRYYEQRLREEAAEDARLETARVRAETARAQAEAEQLAEVARAVAPIEQALREIGDPKRVRDLARAHGLRRDACRVHGDVEGATLHDAEIERLRNAIERLLALDLRAGSAITLPSHEHPQAVSYFDRDELVVWIERKSGLTPYDAITGRRLEL